MGTGEPAPAPQGAPGTPTRVLLVTSHPIDARDGADKELSVALVEGVPGATYTWFGQVGARHREPLSTGRRVPMLSRTGMPGVGERAQAAALALALEPRSDLVHAVVTIGPKFGAFVRLRERVLGGRRRPTVHTVPAVTHPELLQGTRPLGTTVVLSRSTETLLLDAGFPDVRLIPPGIDFERWPVRPRPDHDRHVVAFAGHYDDEGGLWDAVTALGALCRRGHRLRGLFLMRPRPRQDEQAMSLELRRRAHEAGLDDVEVRGRVPHMPTALAEADVVVLPARDLGGKADVPFTLLEAMATGRPVVVTDLPQMSALGEAAVTVPTHGVGALADAIEGLLTSDAAWRAAAAAGRRLVSRDFSRTRMCAQYVALYTELLDAHRTR